MKLQNAFVTESNAMGNFTQVGYEMNNTINFDYAEPDGNKSWANGTLAIPASGNTNLWSAKNKVALNACTADHYWVLSGTKASGSGIQYVGGLGTAASATTYATDDESKACIALTASFKSIDDNN